MQSIPNAKVLVGIFANADGATVAAQILIEQAINNNETLKPDSISTVNQIRIYLQNAAAFADELHRRITDAHKEHSKQTNSQLPPPTGDK